MRHGGVYAEHSERLVAATLGNAGRATGCRPDMADLIEVEWTNPKTIGERGPFGSESQESSCDKPVTFCALCFFA